MTAPPALPILPGLAWSRHKKPGFSTRVASHVSGREVRVALMSYPLYEFETVYGGLASASTAAFAGLGSSSLQTLMGFFLQLQGQFGTFLYADPDDSSVTGGAIATGNGSTQSFVVGRSLGGWNEPVGWVTNVANVYLNGVPQPSSNWLLTAPNSISFYAAPGAGVVITADFTFAFQCRFLDDQLDFEEFMSALWKLGSMKFRSIMVNTTPAPAPVVLTKVVFLQSGTTWTVPSDWNGANNSIEAIGGGGGAVGASATGGVGQSGGGGAYAKIVNVALTAGATLHVNIGAGGGGSVSIASGAPAAGGGGGDTWLNTTGTNAAPTSTAQGVLAKAGHGGAFANGTAAGGAASSCIGTIVFSGGASGLSNVNGYSGAGGGGAAGPDGAGASGGAGDQSGTAAGFGGGGGGGADGGSAGANGTSTAGGAGGKNASGAGGGAGGLGGSGGAGANSAGQGGGGGGGGQGTGTSAGGAGGAGANWAQTSPNATAGAGGGGGGATATAGSTSAFGGAGGLYGGGGSAAGWYNTTSPAYGGSGAQGIIVITYQT